MLCHFCPSAWENSVPTGWNFMKFDIRVFFDNVCGKIQALLESDENDGCFIGSSVYIYENISMNYSLE